MKKEVLFPDEIIIDTEYFEVHQDREAAVPGFFVLEAKRKITSVADFTEEEGKAFIDLLRKIRKGMRETLGIDKVILFQNEDSSWNDFHLWIFPRHSWMEKFGKKVESMRPIIEYAKEKMTAEKAVKEVKEYVAKMKAYLSNE